MAAQQGNSNSVVAIVVAIYMILMAIVSVCGGAGTVFLGGAALSLSGTFAEAGVDDMGLTGGVGALATIIGILLLVAGIAALVMAVGLFMRKEWAYMGTIIINGVVIGLQILSLLQGGGIVPIVVIILSAAAIFFMLTDQQTKLVFNRA